MKDKTRATAIVCFAADGHILPLAVFVNIKQLHCFRLIIDGKPPLPYTSKNSWFDRDITYWWIMKFFRPHHLKYQVNFNAILTLDNFTVHDMKQFF